MATTTLTLACIGSAFADASQPNTNFSSSDEYSLPYVVNTLQDSRIYLKFEAFPAAYWRRVLEDAYITQFWRVSGNTGSYVITGYGRACGDFDESTLTYANKPSDSGNVSLGSNTFSNMTGHVTDNPTVVPETVASGSSAPKNAKNILRHSCIFIERALKSGSADLQLYLKTRRATTPPVLTVKFGSSVVVYKCKGTNNTSGYVNRSIDNVFKWSIIKSVSADYCVANPVQVSAVFHWRQGSSGSFNEIEISGSTQEVTVPAGTFPAGSIQWFVTAKDDFNIDLQQDSVYTISTTDVAHTATPVYPNSSIENGDAPIRFIWTDASDTNTAPTGADLQYSTDGSTWTTFAQPRTSATETDAPASTFPAGTVLWRVRSLNADAVAGPWSASVSFLCFAAPDPPILDSDGKPFLTVTWQSSGQRAYRVTVDGKAYGPYFGDGKSFTVPEYLTDGSHTVRVEVQNEYGLWNGAEITVTVSNVPGQPVNLSGSFNRDAALRWTCEDAAADFLVYRDDVQIGHSSGYSFADRTVLDFHTWKVINRLPGGYYTASNTVSGTLCTEGLALALLAGGPWLDLTLSTNAIRTTTAAAGRSVALRQFAGREYPDAEAAPYKTLQISFDVSWTPAQATQARVFEAMIGEAVIFKEPGEEAFVGVLSAFQRSRSCPARSYTATVQRIHWREYVDADS